MAKKTTEEFLQEIKDKGHWNDDYDYSKVNYKSIKRKVIIIDKKWNTEHLINADGILTKNTTCCINNAIDKNKYLINQFIETHGSRYDYSLVEYKDKITKVKIICPEHGIFE